MGSLFADTAHAAHHVVHEYEQADEEHEGTKPGHHVEVRELHRVIRNAPRHAGQTQEMLREENDVNPLRTPPEVELPQLLVVHDASPLRNPVVNRTDNGEQCARHQYIVEMGN